MTPAFIRTVQHWGDDVIIAEWILLNITSRQQLLSDDYASLIHGELTVRNLWSKVGK